MPLWLCIDLYQEFDIQNVLNLQWFCDVKDKFWVDL